jgi:hypothetical protein
LEFESDCPASLRAEILNHASQYRSGERLQVSTCGQFVRLGTTLEGQL